MRVEEFLKQSKIQFCLVRYFQTKLVLYKCILNYCNFDLNRLTYPVDVDF